MSRKPLIAGLAALVAAALVMLLLSLRGDDGDFSDRRDPPTAGSPRPSSPARDLRSPSLPSPEPVPESLDHPAIRSPNPVTPSGPMTAEILGDARRRIRDAAATCPRPPAMKPDERYMFNATLAVRDGNASIRDLTVVDSNLSDPTLTTCLDRAISTLTWPQPGDARDLPLTDTLSADLFEPPG